MSPEYRLDPKILSPTASLLSRQRNGWNFDPQFGFQGDFQRPFLTPNPTLDVTGGSNEPVLQGDLFQSAIAGPPQPMGPDQLALGALNCVSMPHPGLKGLGLLFRSPRLKCRVMLALRIPIDPDTHSDLNRTALRKAPDRVPILVGQFHGA